jgi:ferredoxin
MVGRLPGNP